MNLSVIIVAALIILTNSAHVLLAWLQRLPNTQFTDIAHYYADYFLYASQMAQGARGSWIYAVHQFTNEPLSPTWIYWLNVLLGHLGALLHLSPFITYNVSLVLFAFLVLFLWYAIIRRLLPKQNITQSIAFLFVATASNFTRATNGDPILIADFWFSPTTALNRLGGVPHQLFQTITLLVVILLATSLFSQIKNKNTLSLIARYLLLACVSFLAATANPIQMLVVVLALLAAYGVLVYGSWKLAKENLVTTLCLTLPALTGAYLVNTEFTRQPILTAAKLWEANQPFALSMGTFLLAMGPIVFLIPFGVLQFFRKRSALSITLALYGAMTTIVFFSPIPKLLGTSPVRWLSPAAYGVWPIIAALGLRTLIERFHTLSRKITPSILYCVLLIIYFLFTIPALIAQVNTRVTPTTADPTVKTLTYLSPGVIEALTTLRPNSGVVLTDPSLPYDVVIPTLTGNTSFTGHPIHTLYLLQKETLRSQFFWGSWTATEALQFIKDHRISTIITTPQHAGALTHYPFVSTVFGNTTLVVFTIKLPQTSYDE